MIDEPFGHVLHVGYGEFVCVVLRAQARPLNELMTEDEQRLGVDVVREASAALSLGMVSQLLAGHVDVPAEGGVL